MKIKIDKANNCLVVNVTKINSIYSVLEIVYQNDEVINRGNFYDEELGIRSNYFPTYYYNEDVIEIRGTVRRRDLTPFAIENIMLGDILERIEKLNEKYRQGILTKFKYNFLQKGRLNNIVRGKHNG